MCHLIFFLPIFGLPIFWFFPFKTALVAYLIICTISVLLYYKVFQALHRKVCTGKEAMLGKTAVVTRNIDPEGKIQYATEIWHATAKGKTFLEGEKVLIKGVFGLNLLVTDAPAEKTMNGSLNNERFRLFCRMGYRWRHKRSNFLSTPILPKALKNP